MRSKWFKKYFVLAKRPLLNSLLVSILIATAVHSCTVSTKQRALEDAIGQVKLVEIIFNDDPLLADFIYSDKNPETFGEIENNGKDLLWRMLISKRIIQPDTDPNEVSSLMQGALESLHSEHSLASFKKIDAISGMIKMATLLGAQPDREGKVDEFITRCIAQNYDAYEDYQYLKDVEVPMRILSITGLVQIQPFKRLISWDRTADLEDIKTIMFDQYKINTRFKTLSDNKIDGINGGPDEIEEYRQINEFFSSLLVGITTHPNVMSNREALKIYDGIWQWVMYVVFAFAILLIIKDNIKTDAPLPPLTIANDAKIYDYLKKSLPIFGFMGTISGLMEALVIAYKAPLTQGTTFLSAMSLIDITNALSIAFTTTLMAFFLKLLLDGLETVISTINNKRQVVKEPEANV